MSSSSSDSKNITLFGKTFEPFLNEFEIAEAIKKMAETINKEYEGKKPLFISILNGAFMFSSDLFKQITIEAEICFIKLASYKGTQSTGHVITSIGLDSNITDRHIIVLEDIIDTGKTLHTFLPQIVNQQPASLKIATLLHKPEATVHPLTVDYCCFKIPNKFVLGYGLDFDGYGRNTKEIYQLVL
jgi:hypoxanthine phosphoribosyltransferase